jgi:hypothetical protein
MSDRILTAPAFAKAGAWHFFGTRRGPVARSTRAGRLELEEHDHPQPTLVVAVDQVHGTDTLVVDRPVADRDSLAGGWDSLVTNQPGVLLTIRTADCVPVLLHDPVRRVAAAVHAGWRGAVGGIVHGVIHTMADRFGSCAADLSVAIGPAIGPCCYEVDEPVLTPLREREAGWHSVVTLQNDARGRLDLRGLVRLQLQAAGVEAGRVSTIEPCTSCRSDLFFSYRRDGRVVDTMVHGIMLVERAEVKGKQ